jgi:predicted enzyme related to lactoylglutathione lyase
MEKVTGLGGVFLKVKDPHVMAAWYKKHLDVSFDDVSDKMAYRDFKWINHNNPAVPGHTVFSFFRNDTGYFKPSESNFMINFRVKDLVSLLDSLQKEGVQIAGEMQAYDYGKFGWIIDPEGNKIELWEPIGETE